MAKGNESVRNRKNYVKLLLENLDGSANGATSVLNVGSGPCRDVYEYLHQIDTTNISFNCLDMDENAITYSKHLLNKKAEKINFICKNVFLFRTDSQYDLV